MFGQDSGGGFSFECSQQQGAILIMGDVAYRQDILEKKRFADYMIKHHRSWASFTNNRLERGVSPSDLILVTGCDLTSEWACAAWCEKTNSGRLNFVVGVPGVVEGSLSLWGRWECSQSVERNVGPQPLVPPEPTRPSPQSAALDTPSMPSSEITSSLPSLAPPTTFNQCVFLRGFRIADRSIWFKRKNLIDVGDGFTTIRKPWETRKQENEKPPIRGGSLLESSPRSRPLDYEASYGGTPSLDADNPEPLSCLESDEVKSQLDVAFHY